MQRVKVEQRPVSIWFNFAGPTPKDLIQ